MEHLLLVNRLLHFRIPLKNNFSVVWETSLLLPANLTRSTTTIWLKLRGALCSANHRHGHLRIIVWGKVVRVEIGVARFFLLVWIFSKTLRHVFARYRSNLRYTWGDVGSSTHTKPFLVYYCLVRLLSSVTSCTLSMSFVSTSVEGQLVWIKWKVVDRLLKLRSSPKIIIKFAGFLTNY